MSLPRGSLIGRYRVLDPIGEGGMAQVYRAWDTALDRTVAVKVLSHELTSDPQRVLRFVQEAKAASGLNHPYIVSVFDIGRQTMASSHDIYYMAMELVEGQRLREKMNAAPLADLLRWMVHVAEALQKAHERGIVHRDLKPENIMITKDGYGKLLDFGVAKLVEAEGSARARQRTLDLVPRTSSGTLLGTIGYMSPEQIEGETAVDHRSDIFSFGCILYEVVAKARAFEGGTQIDTIHRIAHEDPPPLKRVAPSCPEGLVPIVELCLRKRREDRLQSMAEVCRWLTAETMAMLPRPEAGEGSTTRRRLPRTEPQPPPADADLTRIRRAFHAARTIPELRLVRAEMDSYFATRPATPDASALRDEIDVRFEAEVYRTLSGNVPRPEAQEDLEAEPARPRVFQWVAAIVIVLVIAMAIAMSAGRLMSAFTAKIEESQHTVEP